MTGRCEDSFPLRAFRSRVSYIHDHVLSRSNLNTTSLQTAMNRSQICAAIDALAVRRPVFHSEADFQHELALQLGGMGYKVRLEKPFTLGGNTIEVDIIASLGGKNVGLELKYKHKTSNPVVGIDRYGEHFEVVDNWGTNLTRYDVWSDYCRMAALVAAGDIDKGYAIILTNAPLWAPPGAIMARSFSLEDGLVAGLNMPWVWDGHTEEQKRRTIGTRLDPLILPFLPSQPLHWEEYTKENNDPSPIIHTLGHYRYLPIET
jgi:hypothetical protein